MNKAQKLPTLSTKDIRHSTILFVQRNNEDQIVKVPLSSDTAVKGLTISLIKTERDIATSCDIDLHTFNYKPVEETGKDFVENQMPIKTDFLNEDRENVIDVTETTKRLDSLAPLCVGGSIVISDGSSSSDSLNWYTNCLILSNSRTSTYNCCNCLFSTTCIKGAVLHFVNNDSETTSSSILRYNIVKSEFECDTCSFTSTFEQDAAQHWEKHIGSIPLKCFICSLTTKNDSLLKAHLLQHLHEKGLIKKFQICDKNLKVVKNQSREDFVTCFKCDVSTKDFIGHYLEAHGRKRFVCTACQAQFCNIRELKRHVDYVHGQDHFFKCLHCDSVLKYKGDLIKHMSIHMPYIKIESLEVKNDMLHTLPTLNILHKQVDTSDSNRFVSTDTLATTVNLGLENASTNNRFKCNFCAFSAVLMKYLKDHIKSEHADKQKYLICDLCSAPFASDRILVRHKQLIHGSKMLHCSECNFKTKYAKSLKRHRKYHRGFTQLCNICGFQNANERNMNTHIARHRAIKNIFCNLCSYQCYNQSDLSKHMMTHTNDRLYVCDLCPVRCKTVENFRNHKQTHMTIKPLKCYLCDYNCIQRSTLKLHLATHSTKREYLSCAECSKQYLKKSSLERHRLTHSNIKHYNCQLCSAGFNSSSGLHLHKKFHTGEGRMFCFECKYSSLNRGNFIAHVNKTCAKAKHPKENQKHCYKCGYASSHRSNFIHHVLGCRKLKRKVTIKGKH